MTFYGSDTYERCEPMILKCENDVIVPLIRVMKLIAALP